MSNETQQSATRADHAQTDRRDDARATPAKSPRGLRVRTGLKAGGITLTGAD